MKLIILDRDGVINHDHDDYIRSPEEWRPIAGSLEAIAKLKHAGFTIAVATNQSGIGRGYYSQQTLAAIHAKMQQQLQQDQAQIDAIFYCPHIPEDNCDCRKPKPGLLQQIAAFFGVDITGTPVVGDTLRDLQAAQAMNCQPILVKTGNGEKTLAQLPPDSAIPCFADLAAVAEHLCKTHTA
jgi:D-glycero-D-manno-heptose 1,7-bisphosphate phosphatase